MDKECGLKFAKLAGNMWDEQGAKIKDMVKSVATPSALISESEKAKWIKACEPVTAAWIEQMKGKGIDGAKLIAAAKALVAKYNKA